MTAKTQICRCGHSADRHLESPPHYVRCIACPCPEFRAAEHVTIPKELDWHDYACQCTQHPIVACPNRASKIVAIHAVGRCRDGGLSDGNRVELRCDACVMALRAEVELRLSQFTWVLGGHGCPSCTAPLSAVGDVVRSVTELR